MARRYTSFDALKSDIVRNLFVDTADQNYVVARWCYINRLFLDFYWNGAHCIEKYMKASLLLNGKSSISPKNSKNEFGHDILSLYNEIELYAGEFLPGVIPKPNELSIHHWWPETAEGFLKRLSGNGDANNRYQIFGYAQHREDLYKFDRLVFAIRRLCCTLDAYLDNGSKRRKSMTNRTKLRSNLDYMPYISGSKFERLTGCKSTDDVINAAFKHNLLFAPESYNHGEMNDSLSATNPVLYRRILGPAQNCNSKDSKKMLNNIITWTTKNIKLPPAVKKQILDAGETLEKRKI